MLSSVRAQCIKLKDYFKRPLIHHTNSQIQKWKQKLQSFCASTAKNHWDIFYLLLEITEGQHSKEKMRTIAAVVKRFHITYLAFYPQCAYLNIVVSFTAVVVPNVYQIPRMFRAIALLQEKSVHVLSCLISSSLDVSSSFDVFGSDTTACILPHFESSPNPILLSSARIEFIEQSRFKRWHNLLRILLPKLEPNLSGIIAAFLFARITSLWRDVSHSCFCVSILT